MMISSSSSSILINVVGTSTIANVRKGSRRLLQQQQQQGVLRVKLPALMQHQLSSCLYYCNNNNNNNNNNAAIIISCSSNNTSTVATQGILISTISTRSSTATKFATLTTPTTMNNAVLADTKIKEKYIEKYIQKNNNRQQQQQQQQQRQCLQKRNHMTSSSSSSSSGSSISSSNDDHSHHDYHDHQNQHSNSHNHDHGHSHMQGHESSILSSISSIPIGPRNDGIEIGLQGSSSIQNIFTLIESSHGIYSSIMDVTSSSNCWHTQCQRWYLDNKDSNQFVQQTYNSNKFSLPRTTTTTKTTSSTTSTSPILLWIMFSDDRTALVKIKGIDSIYRYLSLLQLEECNPYNNGWRIIREIISTSNTDTGNSNSVRNNVSTNIGNNNNYNEIYNVLVKYLQIEHGGGINDRNYAKDILFHSNSSLVTVGCGSSSSLELDNPWEAVAGHFLEISLSTYLLGIENQQNQQPSSNISSNSSSIHDKIISIDIMPCQTIACAIVHVGNTACTRIFEDHLILGKNNSKNNNNNNNDNNNNWQILSKTFSSHPWPE